MKQRRAKGKKKFAGFWLKRFFICVLALAAAGIWQTKHEWNSIAESTFDKHYTEQYDYRVEEFVRNAVNASETSMPELLGELSADRYVGGNGYQCALMLFQPETGKYYLSENKAYAFANVGGKQQVFKLSDQDMVTRLWNSSASWRDGVPMTKNEPVVYSIYIKDHEFIPGEVLMEKEDCNPLHVLNAVLFDAYPTQRKGEWVNLTPDAPEGWTEITSGQTREQLINEESPDWDSDESGDHLIFVSIKGSPDAPLAERIKEKINSEYPVRFASAKEQNDALREKIDSGNITDEDMEQYYVSTKEGFISEAERRMESDLKNLPQRIAEQFWYYNDLQSVMKYSPYDTRHHKMRFETEDFYLNGEKWELFSFRYMDFSGQYKTEIWLIIVIWSAIGLAAALAASLLWAVIGYLIYAKRYDLEAYRRTLTGALAHDLKTPLAVISGYAENLRDHTHPEKADAYADGIMQNVQHIDEMIVGVLGLAKLENGERPAMKDSVDLTALLHAAFLRSETEMILRGLTLTESGTLTVTGNAEMLLQLAENLAANAVQHTAEGGKITVTAEGKALRISNPYTGELDAKTLCEPFKRGDAARGRQSGSGLGLSYVKLIASLHKCRFRVTAKDGVFTVTMKFRK